MLLNIHQSGRIYNGTLEGNLPILTRRLSYEAAKGAKMSNKCTFMVVSLTQLVALSCAHIDGHSLYQEFRPQYYCGRSLARAIASLCYDDLSSEKRIEVGVMHNALYPPYYKEQENHLDWSWIQAHKERTLGLPPRGKRHVLNDCCFKTCSIQELLSNCG